MRLALAVLVLLLAGAAPAFAGTYTVHACHTPDGKAAPIDGWAAGYNPGSHRADEHGDRIGRAAAHVHRVERRLARLPGPRSQRLPGLVLRRMHAGR